MWAGVEPQKGIYNQTYLELMRNLTMKLGEAGIYVLVDLHQDLFSRYFCGEGVPDWMVKRTNVSGQAFPYPFDWKIPFEPNGYPVLSACLERLFSEYYPTLAISQSFQVLIIFYFTYFFLFYFLFFIFVD